MQILQVALVLDRIAAARSAKTVPGHQSLAQLIQTKTVKCVHLGHGLMLLLATEHARAFRISVELTDSAHARRAKVSLGLNAKQMRVC